MVDEDVLPKYLVRLAVERTHESRYYFFIPMKYAETSGWLEAKCLAPWETYSNEDKLT